MVRQSANDKILLIGAGVTLYEAMKAADLLHAAGIDAAVIDPFTIRPLDAQTITAHAQRVGGKIVVVEDHYAAGTAFEFFYQNKYVQYHKSGWRIDLGLVQNFVSFIP